MKKYAVFHNNAFYWSSCEEDVWLFDSLSEAKQWVQDESDSPEQYTIVELTNPIRAKRIIHTFVKVSL